MTPLGRWSTLTLASALLVVATTLVCALVWRGESAAVPPPCQGSFALMRATSDTHEHECSPGAHVTQKPIWNGGELYVRVICDCPEPIASVVAPITSATSSAAPEQNASLPDAAVK